MSFARWWSLLGLSLFAAACASEPADLAPMALEPAWLDRDEPLLPCTSSGISFEAAPLVDRGPVHFELDDSLVATGVLHRIPVRVRTAEGSIDAQTNGAVVLARSAAFEVVSEPELRAGEGELSLRFLAPGPVRLEGLLADGRSGFVEVVAYTSQLPIWDLTVDEQDLGRMLADASERVEVEAKLRIDGVEYESDLRLHGGSSRGYPKKSFRLKLASDGPFGRNAILRSEYNDKTMLRYWLSLRLFRTLTPVPAPRSEFVHFRINGQFYGLMHQLERIDTAFLTRHGFELGGSLYEPDPGREFSSPGGNLAPFADPVQYRVVYQQHAGTRDYADLRKLIESTLVLPDAAFAAVAEDEIAVDDVLAYLAMQAVIQNQDQIRKNYYLYREYSPVDSRWLQFPWDLDLTWGHLWTEQHDVLDESIFTDADVYYGEQTAMRGLYANRLTDRLLGVARYRARFRSYVAHLASEALARDRIEPLLANAICRALPEIVADRRKRATNQEYLQRVEELYTFARGRSASLAHQLGTR